MAENRLVFTKNRTKGCDIKTAPLTLQKGHLFATIDDYCWLLDTGASTSFGNIKSFQMDGTDFIIPESYMGLNANQVSKFVGHSVFGIIGTDILNNFNILIDVKNERLSFTRDKIILHGEILKMDDFMGIPIILAKIGGTDRRMFFDTGAQISYFQDETLTAFPAAGAITDFYPGVGQFQTETYMVDAVIGTEPYKLRCGSLPRLLAMTLVKAGTIGIIGNEILNDYLVGYFPSNKQLVLA